MTLIKHAATGLLLTLCAAMAQAESVRVGIREVPPFVIADGQGGWTGISVELWQGIAEQRGWQTEWVVLDSPRAQIESLAAGSTDVAVGALSITNARELLMDFSRPFYATGLAIATPVKRSGWFGVLRQLGSLAFLSAVGVLVLLLLVVGAVMWLVERKHNSQQFGGSVADGIGNGFWWSAVTMTTVGYGDKAPITTLGRVLATIWMFVSVITISGFTAAIASTITVDQLGTVVRNLQDLDRVRSVAVAGSTGEDFLRNRGLSTLPVSTPREGLEMLRARQAEALVHDEPLLRYLLKDAEPGIEILPQAIDTQYYALGMRPGFAEQEALNRTLLNITSSAEWQEILNRHLGMH